MEEKYKKFLNAEKFESKMARLDENGKFINEKTEIIEEKDKVTFINRLPNGEIQKFKIYLRKKRNE